MSERWRRWTTASFAVAGALIALAAWSFWQRWTLLSASPFPLGVDGYFYPVQLRSLLDHGALAYPSSPLAFYLLAPFAAASDPITGAKLGAAALGAAIAFPAYGVGARLGGSRGAGLVAAAIATMSIGSTYLTIEFVKNSIGLTVALAALWLLLAAVDSTGTDRPRPTGAAGATPRLAAIVAAPSRGRIAAAIGGLVAAWACHKMAAAIVVIVAVPVVLAAATQQGALRGRRLLYAIGGALGLAIALLAVGAASPQRFVSAGDAALLRGLVSSVPRWTAPTLVLPTGALALGHDTLLGLALAVAAMIAGALDQRSRRTPTAQATAIPVAPPAIAAAAWPVFVLAIAIAWPLLDVADRAGLGFRLRLAAFVPAALAAAILCRHLLTRYAHRDAIFAAAALVLAVVRQPGSQPGDTIDGEVETHPALVTAVQALNGHVPPGATLIVPERHIAFMVAWYTGAPIALRPEGIPAAQRYRLLPLHTIGAGSPLDHQLMAARAEAGLTPPLGVHPLHPNGLVLVAEPTWAWILDRLPPADRARFTAWPTI